MNTMAHAFAPANISCVFRIYKGSTPQATGSTGIGFTLNKGVDVIVSSAKQTSVVFNGKSIDFPAVISVIQKLTNKPVCVDIKTPFPLGCGFGISGASALAVAYGLNDLFMLEKSKLELAKIAHVADAENGTGLGDVVNQFFGGFLLKTKPSYMFEVEKLPLHNIPVYCKIFSGLSTKSIISNATQAEKINTAGEEAIKKVESNKNIFTFSDIIEISYGFAHTSGLLINTDVIKTIQGIQSRGGHASMIMLGNAVFADISFEGAETYTIQ